MSLIVFFTPGLRCEPSRFRNDARPAAVNPPRGSFVRFVDEREADLRRLPAFFLTVVFLEAVFLFATFFFCQPSPWIFSSSLKRPTCCRPDWGNCARPSLPAFSQQTSSPGLSSSTTCRPSCGDSISSRALYEMSCLVSWPCSGNVHHRDLFNRLAHTG